MVSQIPCQKSCPSSTVTNKRAHCWASPKLSKSSSSYFLTQVPTELESASGSNGSTSAGVAARDPTHCLSTRCRLRVFCRASIPAACWKGEGPAPRAQPLPTSSSRCWLTAAHGLNPAIGSERGKMPKQANVQVVHAL